MGRFLAGKKVGCCAAPERRTRCLWERCSVHAIPNLSRGLLPVRGESMWDISGSLRAVGMDAWPLLPPAPKSQGTPMQG